MLFIPGTDTVSLDMGDTMEVFNCDIGCLFWEMFLSRVAVTFCLDFFSCFMGYTQGIKEYAGLLPTIITIKMMNDILFNDRSSYGSRQRLPK